jgi:DNA-binding transcriptional regulator YhcF (GntR family)
MTTAVYTSLCKHRDKDTNRCFPSMEIIAEQHGIHRKTVSKALNKLEEWNIIRVGRAYDRKLKRRKNNVYDLLPRELWNALPVEDEVIDYVDFGIKKTIGEDDDKSHGTENATRMVSTILNDGTEYTSNNTHITRLNKEDLPCGEPTELSLSLTKKSQLLEKGKKEKSTLRVSVPAVWNSDQAVLSLIKSYYKDHQIIGAYFYIQQDSFKDRPACVKAVERSLRAAKALEGYEIDDIRKTMKWMKDSEFDKGWSLEAVNRYIDDCIKTNFIPNGTSRIELLNRLNTIKIPNELATQPETIAFVTFWNAYPKKMDRLSAEKVFKTIDPKLHSKILDSVEQQKKTEQWQKAEYIPLASKWLENQRWEDEITASSIVDPMEAYARELIKKFPPGDDTTAQFRFSKKYGCDNLLRFKNLFQL